MDENILPLNKNCTTDCNSCANNHNPLLAGLDLNQRLELGENKTKINFKKGEYIFREGLHPTGLYCLRKGKVMVTKSDHQGNSIIINLHKEVTFLGIADYIAQLPYQTKCIALEDSEVCLLKHDNIQTFISENKVFNNRLLTTLASQYQQSNNRLLAVSKKHMSARMADALIELHLVFGESQTGHLDVYLKRSQMAVLSNMSEANAIRHLSSFQKNGIIALEGKKIKILNKKRLHKESQVI